MTAPRQPIPDSSRGGAGCLIALVVALIVIVLVGAVLFLPPMSIGDKLFKSDFVALNAAAPTAKLDGLLLSLDSSQATGGFAVRLLENSAEAFIAGTPSAGDDAAAMQQAKASLPASLKLASAVYRIDAQGSPAQVTLSIDPPAGTARDGLDLYGYNSQTNRWSFLPLAASPGSTFNATFSVGQRLPDRLAFFKLAKQVPLISLTVEIGQVMTPKMGEAVNVVHPAGLQPNASGALQGVLPAGIEFNRGYAVIPVIRNFSDPAAPDVAALTAILENKALREAHIARLVEFTTSKPYKGLAIDYRAIPYEQRRLFSDFISALAERLHNANLTLTLVLTPSVSELSATGATSIYEWDRLGVAADAVELILSTNPRLFEPLAEGTALFRWLPLAINRAKLQFGLSTLCVQQIGESFRPISYTEGVVALGSLALKQAGAVQPGQPIEVRLTGYQARFDAGEKTGTASIAYLDASGNLTTTVWLTTASTLRTRLDRISGANWGGVLLTDLAAPGAASDMLNVVSAYKIGTVSDSLPNPLAIRWTAQQGGKVVTTAISAPGTPFIYQPDDSGSSAQISADLLSSDDLHPTLGVVVVAVSSATPTPSTTPTPSITPTPSRTPTLIPSKVPPTSKVALPPPVAGHVGGSFELGGQVQDLNGGTQNAMKRAGMHWVKHQLQVNDGNASGLITQAHGGGFKILLSVVGSRDALLQGGFFDQYASYVGSVAAQGADAIEVWNEMNIDREWPTGKIDPALYTQLLAKAYNAIKAAHSSTLVISGALAPTGAEGAFGLGRVWNDDHYYAGMAAAGAGSYADCIGAHYNEGVVSANQTSGDPRDSYPTRYFATMLNRAAAPFGGKPVCFTELGYLSPEGYSSAPSGFEWGQNTSVAQQAAWLAQAAVKASGSGRVRLMIVFNVDFTYYGADPQAGYAMIRPGGGCPACDSLGQVVR